MSWRAAVALVLIGVTVFGTIGGGLPSAFAYPAGPTASSPSATTPVHSSIPVPHGSTAATAAALGSRAAAQQRTLSALQAAGVPQRVEYLPAYLGGGTMHGDVVAPITHTAPAPMGIGDFGVRNTTGTPAPYVLDSTSWEGSVTFNSGDFFYIDNDGPSEFGVQLNTVLANVTVEGNSSGVYWIQDVMFYNPANQSLQFLDNIWNFSDPSTIEPASTFFSFNGTPQSPTYYYDEGPTFTVPFPFTVHLYTNSSLTNTSGKTYSTVRFGYDLVAGSGTTIATGVYDTVLFNSNVATAAHPPLPRFQVNGGHLTPTNFLLYDSELMIGGPGGGSTTQVYALSASMQLQYWNVATAHWVLDPTAWTAGTDTGETSQGIAEYSTTAGTMELTGGPSFVEPMWNATPGGNVGKLTIRGSISPDNSFIFVSNGSTFYGPSAAWAPLVPGGTYSYSLPPGHWTANILLTDHDNESFSFAGVAGAVDWRNITLFVDPTRGVYTPLFAWNNAELANISSSGAGTAVDPYMIDNEQVTDLPYLFGEVNDFLFPVFPGVLISQTTAYFVLNSPPSFTVLYPPALDRALNANGLPDTNQLQIELYYTDHGTVWGGKALGGWQSSSLYSYPFYEPAAAILLWGATNTLIGDNTFDDQGLGLVLMQGSGNTVWGNTFVNGLLYAASFPVQFGIGEWESGDMIYNNIFNTTVTADSPSLNLYDGLAQTNINAWNLSHAEPASSVAVVNGFNLTGSIVGAPTVCGNWWDDYAPGQHLPYDESAFGIVFIATGGDYCPDGPSGEVSYDATFTETGATSSTWSVTFAGELGTASAGSPIVFAIPDGTWQYSVGSVAGLTASPSSGTVTVTGASQSVAVTYSAPSGTSTPETFLVTFDETGLALGTAWSVDINSVAHAGVGSTVAFTALNGSYPYTVPSVSGYTITTASGTVVVAGSAVQTSLAFTADPGWLNATITPSSADVWVDAASIPLASGTFSLEEVPGIYSVEVTASGYAPYFNNVSVGVAQGSTLAVALSSITTSNSTAPGSSKNATTVSGTGLTTDQFDGIVVGLVLVALAIIVAALLLRRRAPSDDAAYGGTYEEASPEPATVPTSGGETEGTYTPEGLQQRHPWEENSPGSPPSR